MLCSLALKYGPSNQGSYPYRDSFAHATRLLSSADQPSQGSTIGPMSSRVVPWAILGVGCSGARRDDHHQTWLRGRASEPPSGVGSGPPGVKGVGGFGGCVCVGLQFWMMGGFAPFCGSLCLVARGPWIKLGMSRQTSFWAQKLGGSADPIRLASRSIPFAFFGSPPPLTYRSSAWLRRP